MASIEHLNCMIVKVSRFLEPLLPLVGCHMVDFLTRNHWETLLPPLLQQDLLKLPQDKLQYLPSASLLLDLPECASVGDDWSYNTSDLSSFLQALRQHSLPALDVTSQAHQVVDGVCGSGEVELVHWKGVMSEKKSHEVEIMSHLVAQLAKGCGVDWIVDLGSGRGYLSSSLVLQYGINVVAIDSSKTNTASALVRNNKLQRHWINLKQAEQDRIEGKYVKKGKKRRKKTIEVLNLGSFGDILELKPGQMTPLGSVPCGRYIGVTRFVTEDTDLASIVHCVAKNEGITINMLHTKEECGSETSEPLKARKCSDNEVCSKKNDTLHKRCDVTPNEDAKSDADLINSVKVLDTSDSTHIPASDREDSDDINAVNSENYLKATTNPVEDNINAVNSEDYLKDTTDPVEDNVNAVNSENDHKRISSSPLDSDAEVSANSNTVNSENVNKDFSSSPVDTDGLDKMQLGLVGLHTCGNLAPSSLRLFLANPKVSFLCNVGCCYHLLEEEYSDNPFSDKKIGPKEIDETPDQTIYKQNDLQSNNLSEEGISKNPFSNQEKSDTEVTDEAVAQKLSCDQNKLQSSNQEANLEAVCICDEQRNYPSKAKTEITNEEDNTQTGENKERRKQERLITKEEGKAKTEDEHENIEQGEDEHENIEQEKECLKEDYDPLHPSEIPDLSCGFPLSTILRKSKFALGRNTRMLSCQPADRLAQQNFERTESLFWRALLQVVLLDKLGGDGLDIGHVGRLSAKCHTFSQYTARAIDKLCLPVQISESELEEYSEQHHDARMRLERFFLLRAAVAPVIEGLIILDRLTFLREQDPSLSSHLVQLFDPVTSPRCHALLALRSHKS